MSMSMYVEGIRPGDEKWRQMKAVYDACNAAGVALPPAVSKFFNHSSRPDERGVVLELGTQYGAKHECCTPWSENEREGFEIDVSKLPEDVKILRFYCSW